MKGVETQLALALIVGIIVLAAIVMIVVIPGLSSGDQGGKLLDFRTYCLCWATENYRLTPFQCKGNTIEIFGDDPFTMQSKCEAAIGHEIDESSDNDWNACRNTCRGV